MPPERIVSDCLSLDQKRGAARGKDSWRAEHSGAATSFRHVDRNEYNDQDRSDRTAPMSDDNLTAQLAEKVMGWKVAPGRIIKPGRSWIPRWRFRPLLDASDALELLSRAAESFHLVGPRRKVFIVEVKIGSRCGKASGNQFARTITTAVARALGLEA